MPVDLKQIPKAEPLPVPPDKSRWFLVIVLFMVVGAVLLLTLRPEGSSTHSAWFWFCTLMVSFAAGLASFIARLRHYENKRDRVLWWNHLHQKQYDEQVLLGQQAVGVLGMSYVTPVASNKLAVALLQGGNVLQTQYSTALQSVLTTASLSPALKNFSEEEYQSRLGLVLVRVMQQLRSGLVGFTGELEVHLHHDGVLKNEQIATAWQAVFPASQAVSNVSVSTENDGLMWIDEWLDRQDDTLLLSVEINLFLQPRDQQAESVSALLLASPVWLDRQRITPQMWIHRPVEVKNAGEAVADVANWGKVTPGLPWYFWRAQVKSEALTPLLQAMDQLGYISAKKGELVLDDAFGRPGAAVSHIALVCAGEHAVASGMAQWLVVGDKTTQMVVVRPA
ncbi:hypothetical protein CJP72_07590 [Citrobacter sp. NCU1]|uniref:hypothetical protein n=1 Tax=Citrobacter sp. NCU1 TaxID=2026683 RepID=UPI00139140D9|nr:hypothetical protein [Citrobacter sp. NCU1]NDO80638.1 hypothetical protein [Citrobacter sp. NCU1]